MPSNFTDYYFPKAPLIKTDAEALSYTYRLREALENSNQNLEDIRLEYGEKEDTK